MDYLTPEKGHNLFIPQPLGIQAPQKEDNLLMPQGSGQFGDCRFLSKYIPKMFWPLLRTSPELVLTLLLWGFYWFSEILLKLAFNTNQSIYWFYFKSHIIVYPPPRGCAGGRIGTRFLRPRGTSPLKGVNPTREPQGIEMGPAASSAWRSFRRLCGMYKFTTNLSFGWDVNKTEVSCWEIATLFARWRTQCNSSLWALCSWWVVHRRPVALAKLSVPTHHLSLFRVPWRLNF